MELNNNGQQHLEERVAELERLLAARDEMLQDLTSELDKYRSVMPVACNTSFIGSHGTQTVITSSGCCSAPSAMTSPGSARKQRTQGVSAEPHQVPRNLDDLERDTLRTYHKTQRSVELIRQAIQSNDFMKHFSADQIRQIVECMYPVEYKQDALIIREGDVGSRVYVLEEGRVDIYKDGIKLSTKGPNIVLGELAILYNCTRTATVKALEYCKLWAIDRHVFQAIMMKSELVRQRQCIDWLRRVPRLKNLSDEALHKILDTMEEVRFKSGEIIIKQGAKSDSLYMITKGKAKETRRNPGLIKEDTLIRHLGQGDFFSEGALDKQEVRTTHITVTDCDGTVCLLLDRMSWNQLINKLQNDVGIDRSHVTSAALNNMKSSNNATSNGGKSTLTFDPLSNVRRLNDLVILATIGVGGFGRVELVRIRNDQSGKTFALKQMKKVHIVETCQQEHIMNEKSIMSEARSEFIVGLHKTFKDPKYLYMLMEVCLGGELWTLLRDRNSFEDSMTRFYCGCVVEAFAYLHARSIIYRDLKPENLLIDQTGYIKLVDFGFAKKIGSGRKTWTFCGTPEYVAPEIILNKGHDVSADLWSLGILTYELLTGSPPFTSSEPMKTYNMILKGIGTIDFPRKVSKNAQSIIKKLCRSDATERLGYGSNCLREIHKHKWFDGFNWDSLRRRTLKAPYLPKVKCATDTSNFDSYPSDEAGPPPDDISGWDQDF